MKFFRALPVLASVAFIHEATGKIIEDGGFMISSLEPPTKAMVCEMYYPNLFQLFYLLSKSYVVCLLVVDNSIQDYVTVKWRTTMTMAS